jgi:hypothetical protein
MSRKHSLREQQLSLLRRPGLLPCLEQAYLSPVVLIVPRLEHSWLTLCAVQMPYERERVLPLCKRAAVFGPISSMPIVMDFRFVHVDGVVEERKLTVSLKLDVVTTLYNAEQPHVGSTRREVE